MLPSLKLVVEAWQTLQSLVVDRWFAGLNTGTTPVAKLLLPWQFWQVAVLTPLWFMVQALKPPGTVWLAWQVLHFAVVAMWAAGLPTTVARVEVPMVWLPPAL